MGATNSRDEPKTDKECSKRKVFTAGFDVMDTEANVQVGYKSHTLKRYASPAASPPDKGDDDIHRVSERPTGPALPSAGPSGLSAGGSTPTQG